MTKVIVNLVAEAQGRVCLVRYPGRPDGQSGWFVPHLPLEPSADPLEACAEIARGQLGFSGEIRPEIRNAQSFTGNDGTWHLTLDYLLKAEEIPAPKADCQWFPRHELPARSEVAHHGWALDIVESVE